jgi:DNA-binding transcriptional ArsR family regulator
MSTTDADLLGAMANEKRLEILHLLVTEEMSVSILAGRVGLSQSALSQHLAKLRDLNLVNTRREAQTIYYTCQSTEVRTILDALASL